MPADYEGRSEREREVSKKMIYGCHHTLTHTLNTGLKEAIRTIHKRNCHLYLGTHVRHHQVFRVTWLPGDSKGKLVALVQSVIQ